MNYLKYRANAVRVRLDPANPDACLVRDVEYYLAQAEGVRNRLVRANVRLVISVVKKYHSTQFSFEELLSEGIVTLMAAVDKFDYDRGFRFSTYAYRSISRAAYRTIMDRKKELDRVATHSEAVAELPDERDGSELNEETWEGLRDSLASMLNQLDPRERLIIRSRFGLGAHRKPRTFQSLADKLGVSKERVRQLEHRAVSKLRSMAADLRMEDIAEPLAS
jgi:RNA polymerase primary sigma factor